MSPPERSVPELAVPDLVVPDLPGSDPGVPDLPGVLTADDVLATAASIAAAQEPSGAIPWFPGGETDPWDHVEAAMALDVGGRHREARLAYEWLRDTQHPGGGWASRYRLGAVTSPIEETHHSAYVAVGVRHHWLSTGDDAFLARMWPTVRRALDFAVAQQAPSGQVWWAVDPHGGADEQALVTGGSSVYQGLRAGIALAEQVGAPQPAWELAAGHLAHALRRHPDAFADKRRFSMDWYYPVLAGVVGGPSGHRHLRERWDEFVVAGLGARCVSDRPWVTGAETCELALASHAVGDDAAAAELVAAMQHLRHDDGSYWTGLVFTDGKRWPVECSTWTGAAVVLAVDALHGAHPRSRALSGLDLPATAEFSAGCPETAACAVAGT
ncbi:prenyltransferase [Planosporangium sp. 12N6]|uniref:prenyltransferase n=1 Tax=Planosporangium spinosum TaxID=3402278 RepID=UPI003CEF8742